MKQRNFIKKSVGAIVTILLLLSGLRTSAQLTANAGTNTSICQGSAITIGGSPSASLGSPPYTYTWSPSAGLSSTTTANPSASPTTTTTYTLLVTDAISNTATSSVIINVNPIPVVTAAPSSTTICHGASPNIGLSSNVGGSSYSWTVTQSNVSGASASSGSTIVQYLNATTTAAGTATYSITATANGCTSSSPAIATVTVNPAPSMTSSGTATICSGGTINLPFTSNITSTYIWSATDNANTTGESTTAQTTSTLNNTITSSAPSSTNVSYTVQPTSLAGCQGSFWPVTITVNSLPVATATPGSQTICSGSNTSISLSSSIAGTTYSWTAAPSGVTGASAGSGSLISQVLTSASGGTVNYTITPTVSGCTGNPITVIINVNPLPTISISGSTSICAGSSTTLTATPSIGGGTYSWSPGGTTLASINVSPASTTTYTCTYTTPAGCANTATGTVTVNPMPVATFSYASPLYCQNDPNPFPTFSGGGVAGTFSSTAGLAFVNTSTGQVNIFSTVSGTYIVTNTIAASGGCPTVSSTATITRNSDATIGLTSSAGTNAQTVCQSTAITNITYAIGGGGTGGTATGLPPGVSGSFAGGTFTISGTPTSPGVYNYTVNTTGTCGQTSKNGTITVNSNPTATATPTNISCFGSCDGSVTVTVTGGAPSYIYNWTPGTLTGQGTSNITNLCSGTYTVNVTDANGCVVGASAAIIEPIAITGTITAQTAPSCNGGSNGSVTLSASGGTPPYSYSFDGGTFGASSTFIGLAAGSYIATPKDNNGCTVSVPVTIVQPAALTGSIISQTNEYCYGGTNANVTLSASGGTAPYTYSVDGGITFQASGTFSGLAAGVFSMIVKDNNGCIITVPVTITQPTLLNVSANSGTICIGDTATLIGTASSGTPPYSYFWNTGSGAPTTMEYPSVTTTYTLTVTDVNGCTANTTATVFVAPAANISGHVSYSGGSVSSGTNTIALYLYSPIASSFDTIMTSTLDASGNYLFSSIANGDYLIKIFPDTSVYPTLIPTYYGNEFLWDSATVVTHNCSATTADISVLETPPAIGPGSVSGTVYEDFGFTRTPGDPIPGVDIKLGRNPGGQLVASTTTGTGPTVGQYSFSGLPVNINGEHYTIYVDIPGLVRDSTYSFVITGTDTGLNGLDYFADSNSVYPNAGTVGIKPIELRSSKLTIYPNPSKGNVNIEYTIETSSKVNLSIYNILGVKVAELANNNQSSGSYKFNVSAADNDFHSGVYFISLIVNDKATLQRLVITE
jgi:hypothetical protein